MAKINRYRLAGNIAGLYWSILYWVNVIILFNDINIWLTIGIFCALSCCFYYLLPKISFVVKLCLYTADIIINIIEKKESES